LNHPTITTIHAVETAPTYSASKKCLILGAKGLCFKLIVMKLAVLFFALSEFDASPQLRGTKMIGQIISHYPPLYPDLPSIMKFRMVGTQRDKILARLGESLPFVLLI